MPSTDPTATSTRPRVLITAAASGIGLRCDVSDEAQVQALFAQALEWLGGLDTLVNCAGIAGPTAPLAEISLADWRQCQAVNLDGTFLCCREAARVMGPQGWGPWACGSTASAPARWRANAWTG